METKKATLITGVAGTTGSQILDYLSESEEVKSGERTIIGIDNFFRGTKDNIKYHLGQKYFKFFEEDFREFIKTEYDFESNDGFDKYDDYYVDEIFHMAAVVPTKYFYERPDLTYEVNCQGTINLFNWARKNGVKRFVEGSSSEIYGHLDHLGNFGPNDEKTVSYFDSVDSTVRWSYAEGKLLVEHYLNHFADEMDLVAHLRFANTYGPRDMDDNHIMPYLVNCVVNNRDITINRDSWDYHRTFLNNHDSARACVEIMNKGKSGAYNVGSQEEICIESLLMKIQQIAADDYDIKYTGNILRTLHRDGDPMRRVLDCTKLKKDTGFTPEVSLKDGIHQMIDKALEMKGE